MSFCYDVMAKVYAAKIRPLLEEQDYDLAYRFENLIEEMHEANHRLNDGINKDGRVTRAARALDNHVNGVKET